jgi:DNA-binding LytR/AlgR family response regulator
VEHYHIPFIFLTAFSDNRSLARAKAVHPQAYLVKPFKKDDLFTAIEIALHNYTTNLRQLQSGTAAKQSSTGMLCRDYIFIKEKDLFHKIKANQIRFLKSEHIYVTVATQDHEYLVRSSLTDYLTKFDPASFLRTHRSYAINIDYITSVNTHHVVLGDTEIPIGKEYRDQLMQQLGL